MNNATYFTQSLSEIGFTTQNSINMGYKTPLRSVHIFPDRKTSHIPLIMFNSRVSSQKLGATDTALCSPSLNEVKQNGVIYDGKQ